MAADENPGGELELAALAARVAQLERQVAELMRGMKYEAVPEPAAARAVRQPEPTPAETMRHPAPSLEALMPGIARPASSPPPPMPAPMAGMQHTAPERSLENRLGSQIFNMIAVLAILIGTALFLKLAIEREWIGPVARVLIGLAAGAGLVVWSESFRRKGFAAFSYSLKAVGSAVLYLSLWAAFQLYHLLPAGVALFAMVLVTAWNGFMAWSQDAELLAAYGLIGGFVTPLLLATGGNHETFLFTYIAAIDLATVLLMRWKPWQRLLLPAFATTVGYFIGWYAKFFHEGVANIMDAESWTTTIFVLAFFALFALLSVKGFKTGADERGEIVIPVLIPLANAAFVSLALYSVMQDSGLHAQLAWLMVVLAALYLGLARVQATAVAGAMHLASAVVFLTIAIPLKASGHSLTTAWLVEGLVLYWAATRVEAESGAPAKVLEVLSACGYALGLMSLAVHWSMGYLVGAIGMPRRYTLDAHASFFNANLGTALIAIGVVGGAALLAAAPAKGNARALSAALMAIDAVAVLLTLREVGMSAFGEAFHAAFASAEFATALIGLTVLATAAWAGYRASRIEGFASAAGVAGATLVVFNLLTVLTGVREIGALWSRAEGDLQRSLTISGFLMVYGASLLAAGFWRRSAFVRWQGLILLLFTIMKVFFSDISGLSQGYRVASFLGLGALLMAVSFAYQKDWLGLRVTAAADEPGGER
jgi:uncharacterized membrane protein